MFDDILHANEIYAASFDLAEVPSRPARGLGLVTCIDSRIDPLAVFGLRPGDAKVLRNAGGRVTDDVLRSLAAAVNILGVDRVAVMHHTDCGMAKVTQAEVAEAVRHQGGATQMPDFWVITDPQEDLRTDVTTLRTSPLVPTDLPVIGLRYDVTSGRTLEEVPLHATE